MSVEKAIEQLKSHFRGTIISPSDAGYEEARKVYNGMIDKRPGAIARCANVASLAWSFPAVSILRPICKRWRRIARLLCSARR